VHITDRVVMHCIHLCNPVIWESKPALHPPQEPGWLPFIFLMFTAKDPIFWVQFSVTADYKDINTLILRHKSRARFGAGVAGV